ncbi:MAG: hypothetical protein ACOH2H_26440 [Cypionkella sp.]
MSKADAHQTSKLLPRQRLRSVVFKSWSTSRPRTARSCVAPSTVRRLKVVEMTRKCGGRKAMTALLLGPEGGAELRRADLTPGMSEKWLQDILFRHPALIPLDQIETGAGTMITLCREFPLPKLGRNESSGEIHRRGARSFRELAPILQLHTWCERLCRV